MPIPIFSAGAGVTSLTPGLHWDDQVKGFYLQVSAASARLTWHYYWRQPGPFGYTQHRKKIGEWPAMSLTQARAVAAKWEAIRKEGGRLVDNSQAKRAPKPEGAFTVHQLYLKMQELHWGQKRFRVSGWWYEVRRIYNKYIHKRFGSYLITAMSSIEIREWHAKIGVRSTYEANSALKVLATMFSWADAQENLVPDAFNPCRRVKKFRAKKRGVFADQETLARLSRAFEEELEERGHIPSIAQAVAFYRLILYTAARPRSLLRLEWKDYQEMVAPNGVRVGVFTFNGKGTAETGEKERIILGPSALDAIKDLDRNRPRLFTFRQIPRGAWIRILARSGVDLWVRDLRRTYATHTLSSGVSLDLVADLLNHSNTETTKLYAKLLNAPLINAALTADAVLASATDWRRHGQAAEAGEVEKEGSAAVREGNHPV